MSRTEHKLPTIALHMIVKDEVEAVMDLLINALPYVNDAVVTVSDKDAFKRISKLMSDYDVKFDHRAWTNDFGAARNHNMKLSDTDFIFWLDADDQFDFSTLPKLVAYADANDLDAIYLPYNYAQDEQGNSIALHSRERIVRRSRGFVWRGKLHESMLPEDDGAFKAKKLDEPQVVHKSGDVEASKARNHEILKDLVEGKDIEEVDPRDVFYYGQSLFGMGEYKRAIYIFETYIQLSGWDEEMYRALIKMGECYFMLDDHASAIEATLKASALMPHLAEAYFALARYTYALGKWSDVLQWLEVAYSKPRYDGMSIQNPEVYELAKIYSAVSHYELKDYQKAYKHLMAAPEYLRKDLEAPFELSAEIDAFYQLVPQLIRFIDKEKFYQVLPSELKHDERLHWLRDLVVQPRRWPKNSIVFYCGSAYEEWGAHTLDKGMGGSEEAIVYLSRELARLGYDVTVYNHISEPRVDELTDANTGVKYFPYQMFDERDQFGVFVAWRSPRYADGIKADVKLIDLHDVLTPDMVQPRDDATYMVKSEYHHSIFPALEDGDYAIVGNGILKSQFPAKVKKNKHSVGYFSAYYRGLETLLRLWPKIREQVPDATLDVYYGWESWVKINDKDAFYHRMEKKFAELKDQGVTVHGRVDHEALAKAMSKTQVWAYPTEFPEIHCITALKAQEAKAYPVTTDVAALAETVQSGEKIETDTIYSDEYQQQKFVDAVVDALKNQKTGTPVEGVDWSDVAKQWNITIKGKLNEIS